MENMHNDDSTSFQDWSVGCSSSIFIKSLLPLLAHLSSVCHMHHLSFFLLSWLVAEDAPWDCGNGLGGAVNSKHELVPRKSEVFGSSGTSVASQQLFL